MEYIKELEALKPIDTYENCMLDTVYKFLDFKGDHMTVIKRDVNYYEVGYWSEVYSELKTYTTMTLDEIMELLGIENGGIKI